MEYPPYPGKMSWRMRKAYDKWSNDSRGGDQFTTSDPRYAPQHLAWKQDFWQKECEAAEADGILKAIKENSYDINRLQKSQHHMVTINVSPEATQKLPELRETVDKWVIQKHIEEAEWVYEQRGDTMETAGQGAHVHVIVKTTTNKADLVKRTASTFKAHIGSAASIDVRPIPIHLLDQKKAYIRGVKSGVEKNRKLVIDKIWRHLNNLHELYNTNEEKGNINTMAVTQEEGVSKTNTETGHDIL